MFKQISGNETVPSKVPSVSEVSDKKKSSLPYILPQKYMPNPTVILASSTSLLHLMPFWPGIAETELKALTLLKGEERSRVTPGAGKGGQASGWKARRIRQQLLRGTVPPVSTGSRTGLTKDSWHCLQPLPASRACTNWALFLKVATGWAVLSGSRAGNHREKWISWSSPQGAKLLLVPSRPARGQGHQQCCVTRGPHAGAAQGSHFTQGSQEEALGYFQLTYRSVPLIFSAIKEENKQNQRLAYALSYNGVTLSFKTSKNWKPDKSGLPTHFLFSYRKTHDFQTKVCGMQLV